MPAGERPRRWVTLPYRRTPSHRRPDLLLQDVRPSLIFGRSPCAEKTFKFFCIAHPPSLESREVSQSLVGWSDVHPGSALECWGTPAAAMNIGGTHELDLP